MDGRPHTESRVCMVEYADIHCIDLVGLTERSQWAASQDSTSIIR